ncbi:MAG TPA: LLM class F420-dependent oxidoreductase [Acidimicrobiia bacterium]|jgi:F420-dependent oxidoreductase-like protein
MRLRIFTEPQQGASYDQQVTLARLAEELGFDAYFRSDHYMRLGEGTGLPGPTDAWITLAGLARDTSTIRLGTLVTPVTFRLPGPLAISVAEVDAMSGGRVELGLGSGWNDEEHRAYGIPFPPTPVRFEMLEEQLEIVTGLWGTPVGERFSFSGKHYAVRDSPALPKPVQQPRPPIVIGGYGQRRTPKLAARFASEFNLPFPPLPMYRDAVSRVRAACGDAGRDPSTLRTTVALVVCCATNEDELARRAKNIGREVGELRQNGAAGTPAEVVDKLGAYAEAGAQTTYLQVLDLDDLDHVRLLAQEVMPKVADV